MRRCAEVGGGLLVLRPIETSRPRTITTTYESVNVTWPIACAVRAEPDLREDLQEQEEQRDAHHDLGRHERQQHQRVDRAGAAPAPALQPERERDAERRRDEHAENAEEQRVLERALQRRVVEDAARRAGEPAEREALPGRAGAAVVEREQDRDRDRQDRPDDVERRDEREEARPAPGVAQPRDHASAARSSAPAGRAQVVEHQHEQHEREQHRQHGARDLLRALARELVDLVADHVRLRRRRDEVGRVVVAEHRQRDRAPSRPGCPAPRAAASRAGRRSSGLAPRSRAASIWRWSIRSSAA